MCPTWSDCQPEVLFPSIGTSETAGLSCEPELFPNKSVLYHDNTLPYTALSVKGFCREKVYCGRGTPHLLTRSHSM
jgi:hypothetical protein